MVFVANRQNNAIIIIVPLDYLADCMEETERKISFPTYKTILKISSSKCILINILYLPLKIIQSGWDYVIKSGRDDVL